MSQRGPKHTIMFAMLITRKSVGDIKFDPAMIYFLRREEVYIKVDMFKRRKVFSPKPIIEVHPNLVWKDDLKWDMVEAMEKADGSSRDIVLKWQEDNAHAHNNGLENTVPKFMLVNGVRRFGTDTKRVETVCITIQCAFEEALSLKTLLLLAYEQELLNRRIFVPTGIRLVAGPEVYIGLLRR